MKLHVFLAICSQNKAAAISLAVLVSSVVGGGFYASTPNGQDVFQQIVQTLPQTAAQAPAQESIMAISPSVKEETNIVIARATVALLAADQQTQYVPGRFAAIYNMYPALFTKPDGSLVFGTETIITPTTAPTTAATTAATTAPTTAATTATTTAATTAMTTAATTATEKTPKTTQKTTQTAAPAATTAAPAATTAAPAATTAAPAATTAAPAATTAAPAATTAAPAATTAAPAAPAATGDSSGSYSSDMAYAILDLVNAQRAAAGLPGLTWNDTLAESARIRSSEIVVKWSHTRPDGSAWYTAGSQTEMGENLAYGQSTTQQVIDEWMASPGHAENILRSTFTQMGVSCYYCNGTYYWAQHFA